MAGVGTNDSKLIDIICARRTNAQMQEIVEYYPKIEPNTHLVDDIKNDTSFNFEKTLVAMVTDEATLDARLVKQAIQGWGTNERWLNEILCVRSAIQIKRMAVTYQDEFKKSVMDDIKDDVSGTVQDLYMKLLLSDRPNPGSGSIASHMKLLFESGEDRLGTNEKAFIDVLGGHDRAYVMQLAAEYKKQYKKSLRSVIRDEFSGDIRDALMVLVTPLDEYWGKVLRNAMEGWGTDDALLIRVLVSQRQIKGLFRNMEGKWDEYRNKPAKESRSPDKKAKPTKGLREWLGDELSGDYKDAIMKLYDNFLF